MPFQGLAKETRELSTIQIFKKAGPASVYQAELHTVQLLFPVLAPARPCGRSKSDKRYSTKLRTCLDYYAVHAVFFWLWHLHQYPADTFWCLGWAYSVFSEALSVTMPCQPWTAIGICINHYCDRGQILIHEGHLLFSSDQRLILDCNSASNTGVNYVQFLPKALI